MAKLTPAQRGRLEKLAAYLEGLPEDYEHFDMRCFLGTDGPEALRYARANGGVEACGTVACAVGHGPAAGILVPPRFRRGGEVQWGAYSELFVSDFYALNGSSDWCFSVAWRAVDNGHRGAAARIRYLLAHGGPPEGFASRGEFKRFLPLYAPYRIDAKPILASASSSREG